MIAYNAPSATRVEDEVLHAYVTQTELSDNDDVHDHFDAYDVEEYDQGMDDAPSSSFDSQHHNTEDVPRTSIEFGFTDRFANAVIAHDLLVTVFPGKLYCLPSATHTLSELRFDKSSPHIYVAHLSFGRDVVRVYYCTVCKTTRNSLLLELLSGETQSQYRSWGAFMAQCDDDECVHVCSFRVLSRNFPPLPHAVDTARLEDIPPGVQFGVTVVNEGTKVFASVRSSGNAFDRTLLELRGENDWQCLKCVRVSRCTHKTVWQKFLADAHVDCTIDMQWFAHSAVPDDQLDTLPVTVFPVVGAQQAEIRRRRGFRSFCNFEPSIFMPKQLNAPSCSCGAEYDLNNWQTQSAGVVYGLLGCHDVVVPVFPCQNALCTNSLPFDGMYHGFLRTGAKTFMDMDLVNMSVVPMYDALAGEGGEREGLCPDAWRTFLADLARQSPVQSALVRDPQAMAPILTALVSPESRSVVLGKEKVRTLAMLQHNTPSLAKALRREGMDEHPDHPLWLPLGSILLRLANVFCPYLSQLSDPDVHDDAFDSALYDDEDLHEWFPNAPVRRRLHTYSNHHRADDTVCTKHAPSARYKMPGIFHFCCPHGICLGFAVLHDHESPMHPFTILCQRWVHTSSPRIVIMDNACNLHTYCLRREPWLFRNVWFLVDRLHYANHVNCSSGYRIDNFPFLRDISSVACEVFNGTFKSVVKQAGFMSMNNFVFFTKHFIRNVNEKRVEQVGSEMRRAGQKREAWTGVNELISNMQKGLLHSSNLPCKATEKCVLCIHN
ncbi:hypothetical protein DYB37_009371 [Aphanomyces astaci]|nr:hypothetical protein DYB37_009371 [Aphanomyces astaci]